MNNNSNDILLIYLYVTINKKVQKEGNMQEFNILIVEDDFINNRFLATVVKKLGYTSIKTAKSAEKAIEMVNTQEVDIIFMDIDLEGDMNGIECAKVINQNYQIVIIYTTAFQDDKTIQEASETNIYGYLIKPFDFVDVKLALNIAIKQSHLLYQQDKHPCSIGDIYEFYPKTKTLFKERNPIKLTKNESKIFATLHKNMNHNVSNEYLAYSVWEHEDIDIARIRNSIVRLRKKLPELTIQTITGIGYMLKEPK